MTLPPERLYALLDLLVSVRIDIALDLESLDTHELRDRLNRTAKQVDLAIANLKDILARTGSEPGTDPEFQLGKPSSDTRLQ
jgi:hypothetical protein